MSGSHQEVECNKHDEIQESSRDFPSSTFGTESESGDTFHDVTSTGRSQNIPPPTSQLSETMFILPLPLSKSLPRLYKTELAPVDLRFGVVREEMYRLTLAQANRKVIQQAIVKSRKAEASVCFIVKRPGCVLCHEQGLALTKLVSEFADNQVAAWAIIKEINVDNEGLLALYQKYFRFPFFRDPNLALYTALGDRRVGIVPNPIKIIKRYYEVRKRLKDKGMKGNIIGKGEGMILGGIIIFDRKGNVRYGYQEEFTRELPVDQIRQALTQIVEESIMKRRTKLCASEISVPSK